MRSPFRAKHHVVIQYEAYTTSGFDCMLRQHAQSTPDRSVFAWVNSHQLIDWFEGHLEEVWCCSETKSVVISPLCTAAGRMKRVNVIDTRLIQRINIYFCVKLGWTHAQTRNALKVVFGEENLLSWPRTKAWHDSFSQGRTTLVDLQRAPRAKSGRSPANIQAVKTVVDADRRLTVAAVQRQTGLPNSTVHRIIKKDLGLSLKCAAFVPAFLTPQHILDRFQTCHALLTLVRTTPSALKKVVTMDEAWFYQYDLELKRQSAQWMLPGEQRPSKPVRGRSVKKVLMIAFFDYKGMVYHEFLRNQTVDTPTFIQVLTHYKRALSHRRPHVHRVIHMDNAPTHNSRDTKLHLLFTGQKRLQHPALSPDLAPCDFWLFPCLKRQLRGRMYPSLDALEAAITNQIAQIPEAEYREAILQKWPLHWGRCVHKHGDYFEGL